MSRGAKIRWAILGTIWLAGFTWPLASRPVILSSGQAVRGEVRGALRQTFGTRCKVFVGAAVGAKKLRFYSYTPAVGCQTMKIGKPVNFHVLKAGPLYWVAFDDDLGYQKFVWALDFGLMLPATLILIWLIRYMSSREPSKVDFFEAIKNL